MDKKDFYKQYNDTDTEFEYLTLIELFKQQAEKNPNNIAIKCGKEMITYSELNTLSDKVALNLIGRGYTSNSKICILAERKIATIANVLGILKIGAAYVPVEPEYPVHRKQTIMNECGVNELIEPEFAFESEKKFHASELPFIKYDAESLAYIIFTSGSTGKPKGVMISNTGVVNTILDINKRCNVTSDDNIIGISSMCFDLSVYDIFGSLLSGASLIQISDQRDINELIDTIVNEGITVYNSVPAIMELIISILPEEYVNTNMKNILLSGDWIPVNLPAKIKKHFPNAKLKSLGGATEASIWSIYYDVCEVNPEWKSIPYGYPLTNQKIYILNFKKKLCPIGVQGEIYIGGISLAKGYFNDKEKTDSAFIDSKDFGPLYRTGDYGIMNVKGYVEFLGRKDDQVKINGYRIELGEIETVLMSHENVNKAVVINTDCGDGVKELIAFIVIDKRNKIPKNNYWEFVNDKLPAYMVPTSYIEVDKIPLTANGKVNKRALLELEQHNKVKDVFEMPETETEKEVALIIEDIVNNDQKIGRKVNFFNIGINSVMMVQIINKIRSKYGIQIGYREFIKMNNLVDLSDFIDKNKSTTEAKNDIGSYSNKDASNLYEKFNLTQVQAAYLMGREDVFEIGGISTHAYLEIKTDLDIEKLNCALNKMIQRHEALRMVIYPNGTQKILENVPEISINVMDMTDKTEDIIEEYKNNMRDKMSHYVFDTQKWPLFDFSAIHISNNKNYLFVGYDLLIADGMSMRIFSRELLEYYENPNCNLPEINYSFRDYIIEKEKFYLSDNYKKDKEYWLNKISNFAQSPQIAYKILPSEIKKPKFRRLKHVIDKDKWEIIKSECRKNQVTPSALLCTIYAIILSKYSNQSRLALNLTLFNRLPFHKDINKIIGDFTSCMLLDLNVNYNKNIWENVKLVQDVIFESLEHKHFDGIECIREINNRNHSNTKAAMPYVFTSMIFEQWGETQDDDGKLGCIMESISQTSQVFLDYQASDSNGKLTITWDYVEQLFNQYIICNMFECYKNILDKIIVNDNEICFVPQDRELSLIKEYNNSSKDFSRESLNLVELFEKSAENFPNHIAVKKQNISLSYRRLNDMSNSVCNYLLNNGLRKQEYVIIKADRHPYTIALVIGVMKAGGIYVPVDPEYPLERQEYIIEKTGSRFNISLNLFNTEIDIVENSENNSDKPDNKDCAYVIFTSGSTGVPKGVVISHIAASNTILDINDKFGTNEKDIILGISSMCFDLSIYDIFGSFASGATLVQVDDQRNITDVVDTLIESRVTIWNSVPAIMSEAVKLIGDRETKDLRLVMLSGDWIPLSLPYDIMAKNNNVEVVSLGGATEAAIWSIYYPIKKISESWKSIPYGYPLSNQTIHILDEYGQVCPIGTIGEICIGGMGVAEEYLGEPEKTVVSFVENEKYGRLYRTGDYGIFHKEKYVEFMGRKDAQVKVNGYRIELGEIENTLIKLDKINSVVAIVINSVENRKKICAFYVAECDIDNDELRDTILDSLPIYMLPEVFVRIHEIPLTVNGKVDKKNLIYLISDEKKEVHEYCAPHNEKEEKLVAIFEDVLQREKVGVCDNFFDIGGDSIKGITIVSKAENIGIKLSLKDIFMNYTIRNIVTNIDEVEHDDINVNLLFEIDKDNIYEPFPLNNVQMAYLAGREESFELGGISTCMFAVLSDVEDVGKLNKAINRMIDIHPMMRAIIQDDGSQRILKNVPQYEVEILKTRSCDEEDLREIRNIIKDDLYNPSNWPMFSVKACKQQDGNYTIIMGIDMLMADGSSIMLISKQISDLYNNSNCEIASPEITFRDYVIGMNKLKKTERYQVDKEYWMNSICDMYSAPDLRFKRDPGKIKNHNFKRVQYDFTKEEWNTIKKFAKKNNVTVTSLLATAFAQVLSSYSGQIDMLINMTVFNRLAVNKDIYNVIGDFSAIILLNISNTNDSFIERVNKVQKTLIEGIDHRLFDGIELSNELSKRNKDKKKIIAPVVFTSMLMEDESLDEIIDDNGIGRNIKRYTQTSQVYLDFQVVNINNSISVSWDYVEELFEKDYIEKMFETFKQIIITNVNGMEFVLSNSDYIQNPKIDNFYWAPNMQWQIIKGKLFINDTCYPNINTYLFPKIYYHFSKGVAKKEIYKGLRTIRVTREEYIKTVELLISKKIIINSLQLPEEIFASQENLFSSEYGDELIYDIDKYNRFKEKQLARMTYAPNETAIMLKSEEYSYKLEKRSTCRIFDEKETLPLPVLSQLLSVLKQRCELDEIKYNYASAGGFYPIDVYLYIKEDRVENLYGGIYYYNPIKNCIQKINDNMVIEDYHFYSNKNIFNRSAFTIYLVYNANASMPRYGTNGYLYACIEAGIIIQLLTQVSEMLNLGTCCIGDLNTEKLVESLELKKNEMFLTTIEFGIKNDEPLSRYAMEIINNVKIDVPESYIDNCVSKVSSNVCEKKESVNEIEKNLIKICEEILEIKKISVNDNFFDVGGYSVQIATLIARVKVEYNVKVPIRKLFHNPTIKELAKYIANKNKGKSECVNLFGNFGAKENIFMVHGGSGEAVVYKELANKFDGMYNFYGISMVFEDCIEPVNIELDELVNMYCEQIMEIQTKGKFIIWGWCVGGLIAYKICDVLKRKYLVDVELVLIDSMPPSTYGQNITTRFNLKSERKLIWDNFDKLEITSMFDKENNIHDLWESVIKYFEQNKDAYSNFKLSMMDKAEYLVGAISNYNKIKPRDLIFHLNKFRSILRAVQNYCPINKGDFSAMLFKARDSKVNVNKDKWQEYMSGDLLFKEVSGNHFDIIKKPYCDELVDKFIASLDMVN